MAEEPITVSSETWTGLNSPEQESIPRRFVRAEPSRLKPFPASLLVIFVCGSQTWTAVSAHTVKGRVHFIGPIELIRHGEHPMRFSVYACASFVLTLLGAALAIYIAADWLRTRQKDRLQTERFDTEG